LARTRRGTERNGEDADEQPYLSDSRWQHGRDSRKAPARVGENLENPVEQQQKAGDNLEKAAMLIDENRIG
jgi:hypothetical protein